MKTVNEVWNLSGTENTLKERRKTRAAQHNVTKVLLVDLFITVPVLS